jgi:creatinine amidohydrolase/Fe(II)-dependent formamide hydrolase-like protein
MGAISPNGILGNPLVASSEAGRKMLGARLAHLARVVNDWIPAELL